MFSVERLWNRSKKLTTKKGREGKLDITYNGSFQFSRPFVKHKFQNTYGSKDVGAFESWGDKLATPSSWNPNNFFQTGTNYTIGILAGACNVAAPILEDKGL